MFARTPVVVGIAAAMVGAGMTSTVAAPPAAGVSAAVAQSFVGAQGTYKAVTPTRILDTRIGNGAPKALVNPRGEVSLLIAGRGGVPAGTSAVVLNLTAAGPSAHTYLAAYASGTARPSTSNVNAAPRTNRANLVTVPVGSDGRVRIYNNAGTTHIVADVMGYYHGQVAPSTGIGAQYYTISPERWLDSRLQGGALAPGETVTISADFGPGAADVVALAANVTAVDGSQPGYLSAGGDLGNQPATFSSVNYGTRQAVANMTVGSSGTFGTEVEFRVKNSGVGTVQAIVDVVGVYVQGGTEGLRFRPLAPRRIVDTRFGTGGSTKPIGPKESRQHAAPTTVAGVATYALVTNTTIVGPTAATHLITYDNDEPKPLVSNVNAEKGETAANSAFVPLGSSELFRVFNAVGYAPVVIDVFGSFEYHSGAASAARQGDRATGSAPSRSVTYPSLVATRVERR